ncbi:MAG: hypothetical protein AB7P33_17465, partial [Dehalococcoidia bacterium]
GTVKLLHEGLRKIEAYPPVTLGVDLAALAKASRVIERRVLEVGERRLREIDVDSLPQIEINAPAE